MIPNDSQLRRIIGIIEGEKSTRKLNRVIVVAEKKDQCSLVTRELRQRFNDFDFEYSGVSTESHLDGLDFDRSVLILWNNWYRNKRIRRLMLSIVDSTKGLCFPLDDIEPYREGEMKS